MYALVRSGYRRGCSIPYAHAQEPLLGQLFSEVEHGVPVVHLWPHDYSQSSRHSGAFRPLATLWRPSQFRAAHSDFVINGLELLRNGSSRQWVMQRWLCEPMNADGMRRVLAERSLEARKERVHMTAVDDEIARMAAAENSVATKSQGPSQRE